MDEVLKQVILGAPNLVVALWVIWWSFKRLEQMTTERDKLIDELLAMCTQNRLLLQAANGRRDDSAAQAK